MSRAKIHLIVSRSVFGTDQREARKVTMNIACHFLLSVNSRRITAGRRPGRAQRAVRAAWTGGRDPYNDDGENGRLRSLFIPARFSSRCRHASIRIFSEPSWLHASWDPRFSRCCYLANGLVRPRDGRSHLNSANFLFPTKSYAAMI